MWHDTDVCRARRSLSATVARLDIREDAASEDISGTVARSTVAARVMREGGRGVVGCCKVLLVIRCVDSGVL